MSDRQLDLRRKAELVVLREVLPDAMARVARRSLELDVYNRHGHGQNDVGVLPDVGDIDILRPGTVTDSMCLPTFDTLCGDGTREQNSRCVPAFSEVTCGEGMQKIGAVCYSKAAAQRMLAQQKCVAEFKSTYCVQKQPAVSAMTQDATWFVHSTRLVSTTPPSIA